MNYFNKEELNFINQKLQEADDMQMKNGNKFYTLDEIKDRFLIKYKEMNNYRI